MTLGFKTAHPLFRSMARPSLVQVAEFKVFVFNELDQYLDRIRIYGAPACTRTNDALGRIMGPSSTRVRKLRSLGCDVEHRGVI
jgi:hypothetical protein